MYRPFETYCCSPICAPNKVASPLTGDTLSAMSCPVKLLICAACLVLLQACSSSPGQEAAAESAEPVPEITLNMPQSNCACEEETQDYTFLEKGFQALHQREYLESLQYFQRYQRIEKSAVTDVPCGVIQIEDHFLEMTYHT